MKLLVNLSWKCQLSCPYCLLPHIKINRQAQEHTWQEWAEAFIKHLPYGSSVDIAGGEPLLFPGLPYILQSIGEHGIKWAITTNALDDEGVTELIWVNPIRCMMINVSDHPGNIGAAENIRRLSESFPVVFNRVDHPDAGTHFDNIRSVIPYQRYREGTELDGIKRYCHAGIHHWVIDPGGDVFICNVAMATGRDPIGNLFYDETIKRPKDGFICDWGCSSCYTSVPNAWLEDAHAL